ncbi:MAG: CDP-glucose 4,6-dehydratase [Coriobacteriia bacterium]|nr:CDP-glucose 4,6-dehydratase [Coriobacteriia bacterium]
MTLTGAFEGRTVLVTGHTGFKGSWLTRWLVRSGARVVGLALEPYTDRDNFVVCGMTADLADHAIIDVRDAAAVAAFTAKNRPDVVFHLAAQPLVRLSYEQPADTFSTNVVGCCNVLDAVRACDSVAATLVITSDKCYRNNEWVWGYRETDTLGGHDPYSASKAAEEIVVSSYRDSFFTPRGRHLASVRAGNVIGGGDWAADRIVPDAVRALSSGSEIGVRNPGSTRPWQHVLEPLGGYLLLAASMLETPGRFDEAFNFGPADDATITVGELSDLIVSAWGSGAWAHTGEQSAVHEAGWLALDCSKAHRSLGWEPQLTVEEAVEWTIEWYRTQDAGGDCSALVDRQIDTYARRAGQSWLDPHMAGGSR